MYNWNYEGVACGIACAYHGEEVDLVWEVMNGFPEDILRWDGWISINLVGRAWGKDVSVAGTERARKNVVSNGALEVDLCRVGVCLVF